MVEFFCAQNGPARWQRPQPLDPGGLRVGVLKSFHWHQCRICLKSANVSYRPVTNVSISVLNDCSFVPRPRTISNQQILEAAKRCFLEQGPHVSMEVIAEDLGVSSQAILKRFGSKQEIILAAMAPADEATWIPLVEAGPNEHPIRQQLTEILEELATFFVQMARQISVLQFSGVDPRHLMDRYDEAPPLRDIRVLATWLDRAAERNLIRSIDSKAMAMMMLTSMHGPAMLTDMLGQHPTGHSQSQYVNFVVDIVLQGLHCDSDTSIPDTRTGQQETTLPTAFHQA